MIIETESRTMGLFPRREHAEEFVSRCKRERRGFLRYEIVRAPEPLGMEPHHFRVIAYY